MTTARAQYTERQAWLGQEFGENYARKLFGDAVVDSLPRYVRGKNAGKLKAQIQWVKVDRGGWVSQGNYHGDPVGHVERRVGDVIAARIVQTSFGTGHIEEVYAQQGETAKFVEQA